MSMGHQIIICPVANALVRPGLTAIFINMQIYHIAVLKHTLNTDLSPLTYTIHFIVVYTNITILTIHITLFLIKVFQRTNQTDIINTQSIKLLI